MQARRIGVNELARRLGVSRALVSMWCSGSRTPDRSHILAIGLVLEFRVSFVNEGLLAGGFEPLPEQPDPSRRNCSPRVN